MNKVLEKAIKIAGGQTALAEHIGVQPCYISRWMSRQRLGIPAKFILPISKVTGMPVEELLENKWEPDPPDLIELRRALTWLGTDQKTIDGIIKAAQKRAMNEGDK